MQENQNIRLALTAAIEASKILMDFYLNGFSSELKADGSPVTQADMASSKLIKEILSKTNIPVIDEESEALPYSIRKEWTQCWCVDPLDGTKEFIRKNGEFAVNIALIENTKPIFGLIASPVKKEIIAGGRSFGVYLIQFEDIENPENWKNIDFENNSKQINIIASRSHESSQTSIFTNQLLATINNCGLLHKGSALKFFDLAQNLASIYPRFAPTMEWDIAAGQAIMEALGGRIISTSTLKPLSYNKENLLNPFFLAFSQEFSVDFFENTLLLSK